MIEASTKDAFEKHLTLALSQAKGNSNILEILNTLNCTRESYAHYVIKSTPGTMLQRGSSRSEQNHWSVISFIGKEFTGELEEILKFLLDRQRDKSIEVNLKILKSSSNMRIKYHKLKEQNRHPILIQASRILNEWGFNKFRYNYELLSQYNLFIDNNGSTVIFKSDQKESPRIFLVNQERCGCNESINVFQQCVHKIKKIGRFIP